MLFPRHWPGCGAGGAEAVRRKSCEGSPSRLVLLLAVGGSAPAQTSRLYDQQGRGTGRTEDRGGTTYFYDQQGRATGRAEQRGGTTYYYDRQGRGTGRAQAR